MTLVLNERAARSSAPEDHFVDLFAEVFGLAQVQLLAHEYPVEDVYGLTRYVDYALRTVDEQIAFEIDGLQWHLPGAITVEEYEDALLRQNSLVHQGWRVFRWTDRELAVEPERVKEQLALFLERVPGLLAFDHFLPQQRGELFELRQHQAEALDALDRMRREGKTIALLTHAQGSGKTVVAICDARGIGGRTLFLAHRRELVVQACDAFRELWPEEQAGLYFADVKEDAFNIAGSIQSVSDHLKDFAPDAFKYVVIDEAHHATAPIYRRVLGYFRPQFVLGLTATPDRADGQSTLDIFRECAHRLTLREAVERGELVPIRCVRVVTNVDLSRVRFNQIQYHRQDIEQSVVIPARDRLIVDTYQSHVPGRKAVAFCVNVRHGEALADLFRRSGVPARAISGRLSRHDREESLAAFRRGELQVLCACDILNEGWNCPEVEVLLMARPTLSKVIYLQQLGRGTRKAPGKECLIVFDFVDNSTRYNQALSLHRVVGERHYRPGGLVIAPPSLHEAEQGAIASGGAPTAVIEIGVWAKAFQEIDLFDWQEQATGMLSVRELELELAAPEGTVRRALERGTITADHVLPLGDRTHHYFQRERTDEIRETLGLPQVDSRSIKALFEAYVGEMDMSASYKPVLLLAMLDSVDNQGRAKLVDVVLHFREFYERRLADGVAVEKPGVRLARLAELNDQDVRQVMLGMPFEKFERRRYLRYDKDLAYVRFESALWCQLSRADLDRIRATCEKNIASYFNRITGS